VDKKEYLSVIDIDIKKVALNSLVMTALLSIAGLFIYVELYNGFSITFTFIDILLFVIGYIVLIILHELFHLIGFWFFGKVPWSSMDYGLNLKLGVAYATTTIPLKNKAMKQALLLPFWMTGIIPMLIGYSVQLPMLVVLGAWLIAGAAGDFAMYKELRNFPNDVLIKDDPVKPRLYVLKKS